MKVEPQGFRRVGVLEDEGEKVGNPRASGSVKTQEPQEVPESGNKVRSGKTKSEVKNKVHTNSQSSNQEKRNTNGNTRSPKMENIVRISRVRSVRREKTRNRAHSSGVPLECG